MIPLRDNIPSRRTPVVVIALIVINVATFLYETRLTHDQLELFFYRYGFLPARVAQLAHPEPILIPSREAPAATFRLEPSLPRMLRSVLTMMFLHGGWMHLIGNMWYLWIFGDNIEDRLGHLGFLLLYLIGGCAATVAQCAAVLLVTPEQMIIPTLGASGAVAAVLGAYLVTYPFARILTLVFIVFFITWIELPALVVLGIWFLTQFLNGTASLGASFAAGGVAWWAHVGGFVAGIVLVHLFAPKGPGKSGLNRDAARL